MGKMDQARKQLHQLIEQARPGDRVASVASLSAAAGGLSTAATVGVLHESIAAGYLQSTRGPDGGYWRTAKPMPDGSLVEALSNLADQMQATLQSIRVVQKAMGSC